MPNLGYQRQKRIVIGLGIMGSILVFASLIAAWPNPSISMLAVALWFVAFAISEGRQGASWRQIIVLVSLITLAAAVGSVIALLPGYRDAALYPGIAMITWIVIAIIGLTAYVVLVDRMETVLTHIWMAGLFILFKSDVLLTRYFWQTMFSSPMMLVVSCLLAITGGMMLGRVFRLRYINTQNQQLTNQN